MRPDEGRKPIISQSAPIASGPEHFQAKWNTWRLGKCDRTGIYSGFSPTARTTGPYFAISASFTARILAGVLVPHLGTSESTGSRALSVIASLRMLPMEFGKLSSNRSMHPALISVPDTAPPRQGSSRVLGVVHAPLCGETSARCGRAVAECLSSPCSAIRASQLPNPWSKPTDGQ